MKTSTALGLAALLCAASATAMAQTTSATNATVAHGIGTQVSTLAKDQRNQEHKGLGSIVRGLAQALGLSHSGDDGDDADAAADSDAADSPDQANAGSDKGLGSQVSTLAKGQKDATDKTALGQTVSAMARDQNTTALMARQNASNARANAAAARDQAAAARAQAQTVRDVVGAAHGRGH